MRAGEKEWEWGGKARRSERRQARRALYSFYIHQYSSSVTHSTFVLARDSLTIRGLRQPPIGMKLLNHIW